MNPYISYCVTYNRGNNSELYETEFKNAALWSRQLNILSCVWVIIDGVEMVTRFIDHLYTPLVTTSNYNSLTGLHTLKIPVTAAHIKYFMSSLVFAW
jgi:hypothetical protein